MKKFFSFAVTAMAILGLGSLTSCHDEDFGASTAVLQERAFEEGFIKEFGKPSPDQSWDFYAQMMESLRDKAGATRATMAIDFDPEDEKYLKDASQPDDESFQNLLDVQIDRALKDGVDNRNVGQNNYSLVSTGAFNIYAVRYVGDIEKNADNNFIFGLAYMDDADNDGIEEEHRVPLFETHSVDSKNNPGLGKTVGFPEGKAFYFYIQYTQKCGSNSSRHTWTRRFYTNQSPSYEYCYWYDSNYSTRRSHHTSNLRTRTFSEFGGCSTLLYSSERTDENGNKFQSMIIGVEDAWGYGYDDNVTPDYDFNDIVFVLEGDLPVPTSKRFFCEDLQSADWDYNDVVFDVTSTGIVLRAVGGTLPVYLEVTDKGNNTETYGELHDLMWSLQSDEEKRKHPVKTYKRNGKTYYKPIRAGAEPGLAIEAVQIVTWHYDNMTHSTDALALTDEELVRFANPKSSNPLGAVKLIVGTVDGEDIVTGDQTVVKDGSFIVIDPTVGTAPAIWSAPSSIAWMKEMVKITKGYKNFYGGGGSADQYGGIPMWWSDVVLSNTYQFSGDVDPDRVN